MSFDLVTFGEAMLRLSPPEHMRLEQTDRLNLSAGGANEFAAAYSALAHTFPGDVNWATRAEAEKAMAGGSARISR